MINEQIQKTYQKREITNNNGGQRKYHFKFQIILTLPWKNNFIKELCDLLHRSGEPSAAPHLQMTTTSNRSQRTDTTSFPTCSYVVDCFPCGYSNHRMTNCPKRQTERTCYTKNVEDKGGKYSKIWYVVVIEDDLGYDAIADSRANRSQGGENDGDEATIAYLDKFDSVHVTSVSVVHKGFMYNRSRFLA